MQHESLQHMNELRDAFTYLESGTATERMPLLFVGHGSPMNAINGSVFSQVWNEVGSRLPKPRAVVCMSAHWLTEGTYITAMPQPRMIYDFYGFPPELYQVPYPAPGLPLVAEKVTAVLPAILLDHAWGLDHGAWSVLAHLFPHADVPVLQLSIDYGAPRDMQFALIEQLRPLREKGIMFVGSGNIVHNLGAIRMDGAQSWAEEFDARSQELILNHDTHALCDVEGLGEAAQLSIPTDDHYRPMLNTLALRYPDEYPIFFNRGIDLGSVSMTSFIYTPHEIGSSEV